MAEAELVQRDRDMAAEFERKESILAQAYPQASPEVYYRTIFRDAYDAKRPAGWTKQARRNRKRDQRRGKGCIRRFDGCDEMIDRSADREDAFTYLMDFYNDYPHTELLQRIYGLVVDLDDCSVADVELLTQGDFSLLRPTYVVNSGHGLHLVYVFDQPVDAYHWAVEQMQEVYRRLKAHFVEAGTDYHVDNVGLVHMFRIVGSRTKLGYTCHAYRTGSLWPVDELAGSLGYPWQDHDSKARQRGVLRVGRATRREWKPNAKAAFYAKTKERIVNETPAGHRYMSLFALVTVAYKCHVSAESVEKDLRYLQRVFNARKGSQRVRDAEIGKAMKGYNAKAITVRRETLNEWLGFTFEACKRNGRTRAEHLARNREMIRQAKLDAIRSALLTHPNASNRELADLAHVSRPTVMKYRVEVAEEIAAEARARDAAKALRAVKAVHQAPQPDDASPAVKSIDILPLPAVAKGGTCSVRPSGQGSSRATIYYLPGVHPVSDDGDSPDDPPEE